MRSIIFKAFLFINLLALLFFLGNRNVSGSITEFYVFKDFDSEANHFLKVEKMGDHDSISYREDLNNPSPKDGSSLEVIYGPHGYETHNSSSMSWVVSEDEPKGRYDLSGAKRLVFYARGKYGGEIVQFNIGSIGVGSQRLSTASSGPIVLSDKWREYSIDLEGLNLANTTMGFSIELNRFDNPDGAVFYLDEIRYEFWDL
jgi:hypothetical protein